MTTYLYHVNECQDDRIHSDVCRQIMWQADIQSREIMVEVKNAAVTLSGRVETCFERMEAEKAAKAVYGVSSVTNLIDVKPMRARTDREIAKDVIAGLEVMSFVLEEVPRVTVSNGVVTLEGKVRWNFQRESAERTAEGVVGAQGVRNLIEVVPLGLMSPCRQLARRCVGTTQSITKYSAPEFDDRIRSLYFVGASIGRA